VEKKAVETVALLETVEKLWDIWKSCNSSARFSTVPTALGKRFAAAHRFPPFPPLLRLDTQSRESDWRSLSPLGEALALPWKNPKPDPQLPSGSDGFSTGCLATEMTGSETDLKQ
jgi:hypothetical protein